MTSDVIHELKVGRVAVGRHLEMVKNVLEQAPACQAINLEERREYDTTLHISKGSGESGSADPGRVRLRHMPSISAQLVLDIAKGRTRDYCAVLILQRELLSATLDASRALDAHQTAFSVREDVDELSDFLGDMAWLHMRILYEVLDASNAFFDTSYLHADKISEQTTMYLGYLASFVLKTARFTLSPPMLLKVDPHAQHRVGGSLQLHSQAASAAPQSLSKSQAGASTPSTQSIPSPSKKRSGKPYKGEQTLLDFVSGSGKDLIDESWRYQEGAVGAAAASDSKQGFESTAVADVQGQLLAPAMQQRFDAEMRTWLSLLPLTAFAPKLDIVIYVVKAQKTYLPLGTCIPSNSPGYTTCMFICWLVSLLCCIC